MTPTIQQRIELLKRHGDFDPVLIAGILGLDLGDVVGVLADPSHVPSSGGSVWEPVVVPTDLASYDTDNAVGTWVANEDGSISQTDATQTSAQIVTLDSHFGAAWIVQADIRVDAVNDSFFGAACMFAAGLVDTGGGLNEIYAGAGLDAPDDVALHAAKINAFAYGDAAGFPNPTHVDLDDWHTIRTSVLHGAAFTSFDGDQIGWGFAPQQNAWGGLNVSPFGLMQIVGALSFRNLKAWRIPIPVVS